MRDGLRQLTTTVSQALRDPERWPLLALMGGAGAHALASLSVLVVAALVFPQEAVGIITLVVALQFVLSQGFTLGINLAVLYRSSDTSRPQVSPLHGLLNVLLVSVALAAVFLSVFGWWGAGLFPEALVDMRWQLATYGVMAACVKVFLAELNARRDLRAMGMVLGLRGVLVASALAVATVTDMTPGTFVWLAVVLPEAVAAARHVVYAWRHPARYDPAQAWPLLRADLGFGSKAITGAMLLESAIKADVLMLGALTDARTTGLYALVSVVSDLFIQCMVFARVFLNPRFTEAHATQGTQGLLRLVGRVLRWAYPIGMLGAALLAVGALAALHLVPALMAYRDAATALVTLCAFLCLTAGFFPLLQLLGQVGRPGAQSMTHTMFFVVNILLNALLIPHWGATGAALATGLAYVVHAVLLSVMLRSISSQPSMT